MKKKTELQQLGKTICRGCTAKEVYNLLITENEILFKKIEYLYQRKQDAKRLIERLEIFGILQIKYGIVKSKITK